MALRYSVCPQADSSSLATVALTRLAENMCRCIQIHGFMTDRSNVSEPDTRFDPPAAKDQTDETLTALYAKLVARNRGLALERGLSTEEVITFDQFTALRKNGGVCQGCGARCSGIDRISSAGLYTMSNCWCVPTVSAALW